MEPYVGEIRAIGGVKLPTDWAYCDGSLLAIEKYSVLYTLIGTTYGGDGITNFALPDLRSRIPLGQSSNNPIGRQGGTETVKLATENLPEHRHAPACSTDDKTNSKNATDAFWSASPDHGKRYAPPPATIGMNVEGIQAEGGNQPHENRMPVLAVNYIISLFGLYPPRG
jgi:microcystin-dependent protein